MTEHNRPDAGDPITPSAVPEAHGPQPRVQWPPMPVDAARRAALEATAKYDPLGLLPATKQVLGRALKNPVALTAATTRFSTGVVQAGLAAAARAAGVETTAIVPDDPKDRRFGNRAWKDNAGYFAIQQMYALTCNLVDEVLAAGNNDDDVHDRKAAFGARLAVEGLSPTNFPLTNPDVLTRAIETGGLSLVRGAKFFVEDLMERGGLPSQVDDSGFTVGGNLACTPGKVVYRNDLMEVLQYTPQTEQVHEIPLLFSPPWINKYYVMDLAPERSLVEWAIRHQRTVFMISYRDPDESMQHLGMDDYLEQGVLTAIDVVRDITGHEKIDLLGLCLGGAMVTMATAHLVARGDDRVNSLTTMNSLLDYSNPGELGIMVDDATLERLQVRMDAKGGVLPAKDMATAFDVLRPRDLIFRYIPTRWLMGEESPAFDVLAWNVDAVRMPADMHASYLHSLYGENLLAKGEYVIGGVKLDLSQIKIDGYVVGAINDHIVPWTSSFQAVRLQGGTVRYVLSSGGHIAGVVNPPGPKAWYEALEPGKDAGSPADSDAWKASVERHKGHSWWEDWAVWSSERAGALIDPPSMGSDTHRILGEAPGRYVHGG
ncbi:PHA/PHB synthase family protein [Kribbia dieselivorans]|uniref:PHA/PHB synthase family protein n=1 Tax=Kribbia dieselivorans TaxID=331526 RepID=UPI000A79C9C9|nr:alpha/beta fold hydrolase [Kribbia dieselivorans]